MKNSEILAEQELRDIYYGPSAGYQSAERLCQKDLRERPPGAGATGPCGHEKGRKQKQGVPLDTNGRRNSEPIRLCHPRTQKEHVQQGCGVGYPLRLGSRRPSPTEVQGRRHGQGEQI